MVNLSDSTFRTLILVWCYRQGHYSRAVSEQCGGADQMFPPGAPGVVPVQCLPHRPRKYT